MSANDRDEVIRVGDVVWLAIPSKCCASTQGIGAFRRVGSIFTCATRCDVCGHRSPDTLYATDDNGDYISPVYRLKKLHPPTDEITTTENDEVTV